MLFKKIISTVLIIFIIITLSSCFFYEDTSFLKYSQSYNDKISKFKQYKGYVYVNDSVAFGGQNREYKKHKQLYEIVEIGDSISIKAYQDTIYLYKTSGKKYLYARYDN